MRIDNYLNFSGKVGFSGLFFTCGDFGIVDGDTAYERFEKDKKTVFEAQNGKIKLRAEFECVGDLCIRRDSLENISGGAIEINDLVSRFCLDGNDYDVYTQYSAWQHESSGAWQRLTTQIRAEACGMRGCDGAAPIMGFSNLITGKNTVFHLLPNAKWQMTAKKFPRNEKEMVVFEAGFCDTGLRFCVNSGEKIYLPEIIFFSAESRTDLDAYKLHRYFNRAYPRRALPVLYNSWLYCFDDLDIDALKAQADAAAEMGFEAFMIDAGWFGEGECGWGDSVGDWSENLTGGPRGRLLELSEHVRDRSMTFGLWFEPERASAKSRAVAAHPDYYIPAGKQFLLDFSKPEAVEFITEVIAGQIEKYRIGWVKFDFNASIPVDPSGSGFYRYLQGQRRFVEELKRRFPSLYITNCASGGYRMELYQAQFTDSFWLSDNQGPLGGLDIVKGTLKRMPSACIERWNVQKYADGFPKYGHKEKVGVMFNCNNATWDSIVAVDCSFVEAFLTGGVVGFSCDIAAFPEQYRESWKQFISEYKTDRDFYINAAARILADTEPLTVIEYFDVEYDRCEVQIFTKVCYAENLTVYPEVDISAEYILDGELLDGRDIAENGILVDKLRNNRCRTLSLKKADR